MAVQAKLELLLELKNKLKTGLSQAKSQVSGELQGLKSQLNKFSDSNMEAFSSVKDEIPGVGRALSLLANPYALAAAAALAFGAATIKAVNMAVDWEEQMAKVNVTAQKSPAELAKISDQILRIGSNSEIALDQVPDAFNRIISAGLDVDTSLQVLEPTLKAVKAGFTDAQTVAAAAVGVMNSSGKDINVVYDTLFATLNKGNAEFKDIAQYLPKIIPGARQAGFELGDVAGAFAFLTAKGQTAEQSTTGLMNVFKSFSDPRFIEGFKKIGVNVFDEFGKVRGVVPIIQDLKKSMQGLTTEQAAYKLDLVGLDRDAIGAFAVMTQNVGDLKDTIDFTTNSAGQLDEAFKNAHTSTDDWKEGMNKLKVVAIQYGQLFLPLLAEAGAWFKELAQGVFDWAQEMKALYRESVFLQDVFKYIGFLIKAQFLPLVGLFKLWSYEFKLIAGFWKGVFEVVEDFWIGIRTRVGGITQVFKDLYSVIEPIGMAFANIFNPALFVTYLQQAKTAFNNFDFGKSYNKGFRQTDLDIRKAKIAAAGEKYGALGGGLTPSSVTSPGGVEPGGVPGSTNAKNLVGEPTAKKNLTVNISSLHQGNNIINQSSKGEPITMQEFEKLYNELLLRVIRNVEASY